MLKSQMRKSGKRWRRWRCKSCEHRWSTVDGPSADYRAAASRRRRKLTDEQAREVAASGLSISVLAERYGITPRKVWELKHHLAYRDVFTQSVNAPLCVNCSYWDGRCVFEFPESGASFAEECSLFDPK